MQPIKFIANMILGLVIMTSCTTILQSHARVVKQQPGKGGVIAIPTGFDGGDNARIEATGYMNENCKNQFEIVEEGEVVVGRDTRGDASKKTTLFDRNNVHVHSTSTDITEWRITYKCK